MVLVIRSGVDVTNVALSVTGAKADSYLTIFALVGVLAVAVPLLRARPRLLFGLFLVVVCFAFSARMLRTFRNRGLVTRFS